MAQNVMEKLRIGKITVSCSLQTGYRSSEFVSLSAEPNEGETLTLQEARKAHTLLSKEVTKMAYMDALARGTMHKEKVADHLRVRMSNYDTLIKRLDSQKDEG